MSTNEELRAKDFGQPSNLAAAILDLVAADERAIVRVEGFSALGKSDQHALARFASAYGIDNTDLHSPEANDFYQCSLTGYVGKTDYIVASFDQDTEQVVVVVAGGETIGYGVIGSAEN